MTDEPGIEIVPEGSPRPRKRKRRGASPEWQERAGEAFSSSVMKFVSDRYRWLRLITSCMIFGGMVSIFLGLVLILPLAIFGIPLLSFGTAWYVTGWGLQILIDIEGHLRFLRHAEARRMQQKKEPT